MQLQLATATGEFKRKTENRTARVGIIGMGYVGLPPALLFSNERFKVTGFDIDAKKVSTLNSGSSYIVRIPCAEVQSAQARGFCATSEFDQISEMEIVIICVPTPLDEYHAPDLRFISQTLQQIASRMRFRQLIILESTTSPGTTEEVVVPLLEGGNPIGLKVARNGSDGGFYVAFSPERENPGNDAVARDDIPKVIGGVDSIRLAGVREV